MVWLAVLTASLGCYLLKLAGLSVPPRWVEGDRTARVAGLLPVALLAALVVVQTVAGPDGITLDARIAGLVAAVVAVLLRAPFLVVVFGAAATTALVRMLV